MKAVFSIIALVACVPTLHAESVTLGPSRDTDIYAFTDMPTSTIYTLGVNASGEGAPHSQRTLVQFDLTSLAIPAAEIGTATLRMYVVAPDANFGTFTGGNVSVFNQTQAWTNVKGSPVRWSALAPGAFVGNLVTTATNTWVELDATALVQAWAAGTTPNYGFELQAESETATPAINVTYASMELAALGQPGPQLVITRAVAPVAPPVLTVAAGPADGQITVSWPVANGAGWTLQQAASPAGPWTADTTAATSSDGHNQVTHSVTDAPVGFFRLIK
ncbi:MAG: sorting domain protein [Akkermansiaceae bacterium]|nr:sorting domain protein [Akkermansiaceae bacterium]